MDDRRLGAAIRAIRLRRGWRQDDLAARAGTSRWTILRIERGRVGTTRVETVRRVADALDAGLSLQLRWRGGDLDRLVNARHGAFHEVMARRFAALPGWEAVPEVSFSIYGERGVIDILAFHEASGTVLVAELKTEPVDVQDLLGTLDRKRRLAPLIARERGRRPDGSRSGSQWRRGGRTGGASRPTERSCHTRCPTLRAASVTGFATPPGRRWRPCRSCQMCRVHAEGARSRRLDGRGRDRRA